MITIRDAKPADALSIVELVRAHAALEACESPITGPYIERYLSSTSNRILLAEAEGRVIGLLNYSTREDLFHAAPVCLVEELVVAAAWRGRGVGTALLTKATAEARALGCAEISVAVTAGNTRALEFYRSHGLDEEAILLERHFPDALSTPEGCP